MRHSDHCIGPDSRWAVDIWTVAKNAHCPHIHSPDDYYPMHYQNSSYVKGGGIPVTLSFDRRSSFGNIFI